MKLYLATIKRIQNVVAIHCETGDLVFATEKHQFERVMREEEIKKIGTIVLGGELLPIEIAAERVAALYSKLNDPVESKRANFHIVQFVATNKLYEKFTKADIEFLDTTPSIPMTRPSRQP
jgi:hypothetical protein